MSPRTSRADPTPIEIVNGSPTGLSGARVQIFGQVERNCSDRCERAAVQKAPCFTWDQPQSDVALWTSRRQSVVGGEAL